MNPEWNKITAIRNSIASKGLNIKLFDFSQNGSRVPASAGKSDEVIQRKVKRGKLSASLGSFVSIMINIIVIIFVMQYKKGSTPDRVGKKR